MPFSHCAHRRLPVSCCWAFEQPMAQTERDPCLTAAEAEALALGTCEAGLRERLLAHLAHCAICVARVLPEVPGGGPPDTLPTGSSATGTLPSPQVDRTLIEAGGLRSGD